MKKLLFLLLVILNSNLFAQNGLGKFTVKWGPQLKESNSGTISDLLGMDDDYFYFGASNRKGSAIERLDKSLDNPVNFIFEERNKETKERYTLFARKYFADRLFVFKTNVDRDSKTTTLFAEEVKTNQFLVDDNGNFYVLGILYRDKDSWVKKEVNYTHHIIVFNDNGNSTLDYEVKLKNKFIADITFSNNKDGDITCAGFYSNLGQGGINGAFFLTLDPVSKKVKASNFKDFDMDFMTEYMTEKEEKKAKKNEEKGKDMELGSYHLNP